MVKIDIEKIGEKIRILWLGIVFIAFGIAMGFLLYSICLIAFYLPYNELGAKGLLITPLAVLITYIIGTKVEEVL